MLPLIPVVVTTLAGLAFFKAKGNKSKGEFTPRRQELFQRLVNECKDSTQLREFAVRFRNEGLPVQADLLEKRAALRDLPDDVKAARRAVLKKAFASTDVDAILNLANAFDKEGANGAAADLRRYANGVVNAQRMAANPQVQQQVTYNQAQQAVQAAATGTGTPTTGNQ